MAGIEWKDRIVRVSGQALRDMSTKPAADIKNKHQLEFHMTLHESLDTLGKKSAEAQGLATFITSYQKLQLTPSAACYLLFDGGRAIGLLKVGVKQLFVAAPAASSLLCITPLCVLDFFVTEQRNGLGKLLFECMLIREKKFASELAYDRPSHKLLGFLRKHYGLSRYIPQTINFVVFNEYYRPHPKMENLEIPCLTEVLENQVSKFKENLTDFRKRRNPN